MKYKFFYSKKQTFGDCCPKVLTPDGFKEYSEMSSCNGDSNWNDAVLVYESEEHPKIDTNISPLCECGHCFDPNK
jgi:hypothetical protein